MRKSVKSLLNRPIILSGIILFISTSFLLGLQVIPKKAVPAQQKSLPYYGWIVCEDLGNGEIPGQPPAQRFRICAVNGWQVLAYCLDQNLPPPPLRTACELFDKNTFWCGDLYQPLGLYQILQTPTPVSTATATSTSTLTHTPTNIPSFTPTAHPAQAKTSTPRATITSMPSATPTQRPKMGGGSGLHTFELLRWVLGMIIIGFGITAAVIDWMHHKQTK